MFPQQAKFENLSLLQWNTFFLPSHAYTQNHACAYAGMVDAWSCTCKSHSAVLHQFKTILKTNQIGKQDFVLKAGALSVCTVMWIKSKAFDIITIFLCYSTHFIPTSWRQAFQSKIWVSIQHLLIQDFNDFQTYHSSS